AWLSRKTGLPAYTRTYRAFPNDTLFPYTSTGIKFRTPGAVVYERPFRTLDARGSAIGSAFTGQTSNSGIKGIEIPTFGECLLLPKGPPTHERTTFGVPNTPPLAKPLYEFYNG